MRSVLGMNAETTGARAVLTNARHAEALRQTIGHLTATLDLYRIPAPDDVAKPASEEGMVLV